MYIMQCVASILQRIYIRSLVCNIRLPFGKLHAQDLKEPLMKLFKLFKEMPHKLRSIYHQLGMRTLPLLAFLGLDLAMIRLILSNQLIQRGVIYESSPLFSFLMGYINGVLQHGIKEASYD
jgi:hypothetical protein